MAQKTMYKAINNSPVTTLAQAITATATEIELVDATVLPAGPNIATIGTDESAELVLYTSISSNRLTGCTRGFNSTIAKQWPVGSKIYRGYTAYDHDTFKKNIEDLDATAVRGINLGGSPLAMDSSKKVNIPVNAAGGVLKLDENGLIAPAYIPGLTVHRWGVQIPADSQAACTRLYDAQGMVANAHKGSYNDTLRNDFDDVFLMKEMEETIGYDIAGKKIVATSSDGTLLRDGSTGDVFKYKPPHYHLRKKLSDGSEIRAFSDGPLPEYEYVPGVLVPVYLASAYDKDSEGNNATGKLRSVAGDFTIPLTSVSLENFFAKAKNTGCTLMDMTHAADLADMMLIEFATRNIQTAIGSGISSNSYSASTNPAIAETGANRVVLTNAQAAGFTLYNTISIGASGLGSDKAAYRKITAINDLGNGTSEIVFEGDPVNILTTDVVCATKNKLGQADAILRGSGYIGVNGKASVSYRGIQDPYGHVFQGLLGVLKQGTHPPKYFYCDDPAKYAMSVTEDYREIGECLVDAEGYVKTMLHNPTAAMPTSLIGDEVGAGSTTYWCDYVYRNAKPETEEASRLRVPFLGGSWYGVGNGGPWYVSWFSAPSRSAWYYGSRLLVIPPWGVRGA